MKKITPILILFFCAILANAQSGIYPGVTIQASGNTSMSPVFSVTSARLTTVASTRFTGVLSAFPSNGQLRIVNAKQAGIDTIKLYAVSIGGVVSTAICPITITAPSCSQFISASTSAAGLFPAPFNLAIADYNYDGKQDLISIRNTGVVDIRFGNGLGGFTGTGSITGLSSLLFAAISDFNGDGSQDIAVTNNTNVVIISGATSIPTTTIVGGGAPSAIAVCDINKDGKQDLLVSYAGSNNVGLHLGNGLGGFGAPTYITTGDAPIHIVLADFNNDGNQDFATANQTANTVSIRLGNGLGGFTGTTNLSNPGTPRWLAVADFNEDGKQDLAITNTTTANVSIQLGDGLGGFISAANVTVGTNPRCLAIGDFNGDGHQDFATANYGSNNISVRYGDGTGNFLGTANLTVGTGPRCVIVGDFNQDGKQDLAVANETSNNVSVFLGQNVGEINVKGNNNNIVDGTSSVSFSNYTNIGNVNIGGSLTKTYKVNNTGSAVIGVSLINLNGGDASQFSISTLSSGSSIAAGDSATFTVTFHPTSGGTKATTLHIINTDCDEMDYNFAIQGTGACVSSPCNSVVNVKLFIQGYFTGTSFMIPTLFNQGITVPNTITDSIVIALYDPTTLMLISSASTLLHTNGTASCNFPVQYGNYYLVIKHRNSIETWSANPITMSAITNYDFTTAANKAYGSNQSEVEPGIWAFFSGDFNTDDNIDLLDLSSLEADINNFSFGHFATDINGDGNVDLLDNPLLEGNINNFVFSIHP